MEDTNLVGFSSTDGWTQVEDFLLTKLIELNNDDLSYEDCLKECGYELDPSWEFSRDANCPYFIRVYMTLEPGLPPFFVQMCISPEQATENFVCNDGLSLLDLMAKLSPILQLRLTCTRPVQTLHMIGNPSLPGLPPKANKKKPKKKGKGKA